MTKEEIYDAEIFPLMAKIIDIAKEHKIAMVASFALSNDGEGNYDLCSTCLTTDPYEPPQQFKEIVKTPFSPKPSFLSFMITKADQLNRSYCESKSGCSVVKDNGAWTLVDSEGVALTKTRARPDRKAFKILHDWYYSKIRDEVFKRDGYQCVRCGSKFMLSCHHKEHRSQGGVHSLENLEVLCGQCHEGEHK